MQFDLGTLAQAARYKIMASTITPRPVAWVTTRSADGVCNAAPYSFFNMMGDDPPAVVLGVMRRPEGTPKDTAANILETREFVINLVSEADAPRMNMTCMDAPPEVDELWVAELKTLPSVKVAPPRIASAPASFECRLAETVSLGGSQVILIGEVLVAHIADEFVIDPKRFYIDTVAMNLVARMHGAGWYTRSQNLFQLERPTYAQWLAHTATAE